MAARKIGCFAVALLLLNVSALAQVGLRISSSAINEYARRAEALGFSGALLVAQHGKVLLNRGYGYADVQARRRNTPRTPFYLASLSKQYTAAAVLKLVASGKLSLDDSLEKILPDVPSDKAAISVRQLLTHTSGLGDYGWDDVAGDWTVMDRDAAVAGILHTHLTHQPGSTFAYTNTGYVLLAAIVERVSHREFHDFVSQELLRPAGVRDTAFGWSRPDLASAAYGYSGDIARGSYLSRPRTWLRVGPADGLATTTDFYTWFRALQTASVLPEELQRQMFSIQREVQPSFGYGFGWWVREDEAHHAKVIFHAGDYPGYHCEARWYPAEDLTMVVVTNQEFRGSSMTENFLNGLVAVVRGQPDALPVVSPLTAQVGSEGSYFITDDTYFQIESTPLGVRLMPVGQAAVDLLTANDPGSVAARAADGVRTLDLVMNLKHHGPEAYGEVLATQVKSELRAFEQEWNDLSAANGVLNSFQLLGTLAGPRQHTRSLLRLNFERKTLLMGFEWVDGKLTSTHPGAPPEIEPMLFAHDASDGYVAYDWNSGSTLRLQATPRGFTLLLPSGTKMSLRRRQSLASSASQ